MKKDYKNHPFRVGDEVYHPFYGEGEVKEVDESNVPVMVMFGDNAIWFSNSSMFTLSFTPYEINSNWERPFEPKDGDVVYREYGNSWYIEIHKECVDDKIYCYAYLSSRGLVKTSCVWALKSNLIKERAATEEEKQQLFDALAKEGKRWNAEKKCIEDDDTPKIGDKCIFWDGDCDSGIVGILSEINTKNTY